MDSASRLGVVSEVKDWLHGCSATFFETITAAPDTDWVLRLKDACRNLREGTRNKKVRELDAAHRRFCE